MTRSPFDQLSPDLILTAVERAGFRPTGETIQLNSYENRVFDVRVESEEKSVIAKFYRPGRWSAAALQDEHEFLADLRSEGIPAVAPLLPAFQHGDFLTAIFPKIFARMPQELFDDDLKEVGRLLARLHNIGARKPFQHRPILSAETYGYDALDRLDRFVYPELWHRYRDAAEAICEYIEDELDPRDRIRIHGDCHKGNLLRTDPRGGTRPEFFFVDFDDCCQGPPIQDFYMLLSGAIDVDETAANELETLLDGYEELRKVPTNLHLIEALRGLRIIHYAGWIAARWSDPFFPSLFPAFQGGRDSYNYWVDECLRLEQIANNL